MLQQPSLPATTQQLGGGGGGFAHAQTSGFAELLNSSPHWGGGTSASGGAPLNPVPSAAAAPRPTLSPVGPLLAPASAAALAGMAPMQQLRFGGAGGDLLSGHAGHLGMAGGPQLPGVPAFSAAPSAAGIGQVRAVGVHRRIAAESEGDTSRLLLCCTYLRCLPA